MKSPASLKGVDIRPVITPVKRQQVRKTLERIVEHQLYTAIVTILLKLESLEYRGK